MQAMEGGGQAVYALPVSEMRLRARQMEGLSDGDEPRASEGEESKADWFDEFYDASSDSGDDEQQEQEQQQSVQSEQHGQEHQQSLQSEEHEQLHVEHGQQHSQQQQGASQQHQQHELGGGAGGEKSDAEAADFARGQLPGSDGSKYVRRAVKKRWVPHSLTAAEEEAFRKYLWEVFKKYGECEETQEQVERCLALPFPFETARIRSIMPTTYEQFLDALEQLGIPVGNFSHDYDSCPCGSVCRLEAQHAQQCPLPHCQKSRSQHKRFKYR
ncbi:hypothetical protein DUNSADRAFT_2067 [Dunaliella salina]|uniref:Uncharacterized protein n=1 Tax=Dunaliella salina TaxID=3046 RepID=A0ABQ7FWR6_DUNSA|nr:hypothetical protein DUNSADRAFT_2067 [Dunaliella salina]|eukprot:KAF5826780.1 hypothetical protein DUNSADRAFT_2067 [Dunaliella salina]